MNISKILKLPIILILSILIVDNIYALSVIQKDKIIISYNIGKNIRAKDGMTFENSLPSIMGQESSWGIDNLGDKYSKTGKLKSLYDSSLGNFQIKLSTAKLVINRYPHLKRKYNYLVNEDKTTYNKYFYHYSKLKYYKSIIESSVWNKRVKIKNKKAIKVMRWAKREYLYHYKFYKLYKKQAEKDIKLINKLMYDFEFSAEIAGYYLLNIYEQASKKFKEDKKSIYWRAIGRYNGGWNNREYYHKIMERMKVVKKVINPHNLRGL